ncbi:MAG TPA: hypothetical protein VLB50_01215, partial [Ignavibacteriaceae bacterium]|nr:hypothetical protein [Ignavibacteriaceae bacterium]
MKKLVTMFFLLACTALIIAQTPPDVDWIQGFGGSGMEWGYYAEQTSDGGYIAIGRMDHGSLDMDAWLIKTDANGDTLWTKTFGDTYIDEAYCVKQTMDGGYILCGMSTAFENAGEGWLLKTDANGNQTWSHGFHPTGNGTTDWDYFYDVHQLADGNFIVVGTAAYSSSISHQGWIVKVNSSGNQIWNKNYGGDYWQRLNAIEPTSDGGFIAAGDIHITYGDTTSQDGWLVKFDANGDTLWTRNFGGSQVDIFRSVQQTTDGGYIIVGEREPYWSSGYRAWLVRTDDNGNIVSNNTLGPGALFSIDKTSDGNYAAVGINFSQQTLDDVWVIKINDNCDFLWETIVTPSNLDDIPLSIRLTSDGGYIISGYSNYDGVNATVMLVKMEPDQPASLTNFTESFDGVTAPALPEGWTALLDVMITNTVAEVKTLEHGGAPSQPNAVF